jgi:hypothetical protein
MQEFNYQDLRLEYEKRTAVLRCWCTVATELVGGLPADEKALRAFVEHHLGIAPGTEEFEKAVQRILKEEVGEHDITPEAGEIKEKQVYGVNVVRRTDSLGPWLGDWMVKANIKQATSRLGIFLDVRGSKGNFAEAGNVRAIDFSLKEPHHPERIYVTNSDPTQPARTYFKEFMGRVQSPRGATSIIHHSECIAPDSHFAFEYRFLQGQVKDAEIPGVVGLMMVCGLGSVRSMECGKFRVDRCTFEANPAEPKEPKAKKPKEVKEAKEE